MSKILVKIPTFNDKEVNSRNVSVSRRDAFQPLIRLVPLREMTLSLIINPNLPLIAIYADINFARILVLGNTSMKVT